MRTKALVFCVASLIPCVAQQPHTPDLDAQRAAMKKLDFLVGKWAGEARMLRGPGEPVVMKQTEEVQYKLDGLVLLIEGVGTADGKPVLQALGSSLTMTRAGPIICAPSTTAVFWRPMSS